MAMFRSLSTLYMKKGANDRVKSSSSFSQTNSTLSGQVGYGLIMNKFHISNSRVRPVWGIMCGLKHLITRTGDLGRSLALLVVQRASFTFGWESVIGWVQVCPL